MKKSKKEELYEKYFEQKDSQENISYDTVELDQIEFASLPKLVEKLTTTSYLQKRKNNKNQIIH